MPRMRIEATSLILLATLTAGFSVFPFVGASGPLTPHKLFAGFGHEALIAICALMVLGRGLMLTAALEPVASRLATIWDRHPSLARGIVIVSCALASGFLNDTPIVVLMIPVLAGIALRTGQSASTLLMPMNFAVLIGGMGRPSERRPICS
jgi:Na+/H+ antiporter NhaD/arsenite permease-like protein